MLTGAVWLPSQLLCQAPDPFASIKDLKEGTLIVRFPASKAKIDTLTSMAARTKDPKNKERLEKELKETIEERDTLFADYMEAFKLFYDFSTLAYFFDYDSKDLNTANYYNLDGERIAVADLSEKPIFYLLFDRTEESKLDALSIYNRYMKKIPSPFPNEFTRGGINFLFLKISDKKFPSWRVKKINKRLHTFLSDTLAMGK
jgi:hypothetical protein